MRRVYRVVLREGNQKGNAEEKSRLPRTDETVLVGYYNFTSTFRR